MDAFPLTIARLVRLLYQSVSTSPPLQFTLYNTQPASDPCNIAQSLQIAMSVRPIYPAVRNARFCRRAVPSFPP